MNTPVICFGQQPCGFFPKRFLVAKIRTARALQNQLGGRIVFFYHDSDADYRETITLMQDRATGAEARLNFTQENKVQKKYSPLYLKRVPKAWKAEILKQLPRFMDKNLMDIFGTVNAATAADFCLDMYEKIGILEGIEVVRSSDKAFREKALELSGEYYADIPYQGEVVRAKISEGNSASLHEGGGKFISMPLPEKIEKWQKNPGRDQRFAWMNSVIGCTHYIWGAGEQNYMDTQAAPGVKFVDREEISDPGHAWIELT